MHLNRPSSDSNNSVVPATIQTEDEFRKKLDILVQKVEQATNNSKGVLITQVDLSENESAANLVECAKYILQGAMRKLLSLKWIFSWSFI